MASQAPVGKAFSPAQIQQLWVQNGGNPKAAPIAAAVAMAESSGRPGATNHNTNGSVDRGLFQINSIHGAQSTYDLRNNVRAAIAISNNGSNWQPWTTYTSGAYKQFLGSRYNGGTVGSGAKGLSGGGNAPPSSLSLSTQVPTFNQAGYQKALARYEAGTYLQANSKSPWDTGPKGADIGPNPLFGPGLLTTTAPNAANYAGTKSVHMNLALNNLQQAAGSTSLNKVPDYKGYVNPLKGFTLGRTDMGVDANAAPGTPILAMGDSRVVAIRPNWYAGQPYVQMQLLNGPNAGKYWYVAEQIAPAVRPGQNVRAGQPIGRYASKGTGIEIGWGTKGWQTQAQAQGNTGGPGHSNSPSGQQFRGLLGSLGAK